MAQQVPYPFIHGLDPRQQQELYRDFEAVLAQIHDAPSVFDAVIDPALVASNPSTHQYLNLTDLLAHETWTTLLSVGVIQRTGVPIVEPGTTDLGSNGDLALFGVAGIGNTGWQWKTLTATGKTVFYHNLTIAPTSAAALQNGGGATAYGCFFDSNISTLVTAVSGSGAVALQSTFAGDLSMVSGGGVGLTHKFYGCEFSGAITIGTLFTVRIYGGAIQGLVTVGNATQVSIVAGGIWGLSVSTCTGACLFNNLGDGFQADVTCSATSQVDVYGNWGDVTFSGTPTTSRTFRGTCFSLDFTGSGIVEAMSTESTFGRHVTLRGDSVKADLGMFAGRIECVGLTNSVVVAEFLDTGFGWYTFDNSTHNNVFVFGGTNNANFQAGSVSLGTGVDNRVITEDTDSYVDALLASKLDKALTDGHIFVGDGSNEAADVAMSGDVTIADTGATTIKNDVALAGSPTTTTQSPGDDSTKIATTAYADAAAAAASAGATPTGGILAYAGTAAPTGYVLCDGTSYLRAGAMAALFAVIGTTYGAADGTHFNVPDLREKFPLGHGSTHALGDTGGSTTHSHAVGTLAVASHTHAAGTLTYNHAHGAGTLAVEDHTHTLSSSGYAKIHGAAGKVVERTVSGVTSWTETQETTATSTAAGSTGRTAATELGGSTDSHEPTVSGVTDFPTDGGGPLSGTSAATAPAVSGSTATAAGPIDPFVTVNYIIKT